MADRTVPKLLSLSLSTCHVLTSVFCVGLLALQSGGGAAALMMEVDGGGGAASSSSSSSYWTEALPPDAVER